VARLAEKRLLIAYYTGGGNTERMAEEIGKGAEGKGINVEIEGIEGLRVAVLKTWQMLMGLWWVLLHISVMWLGR